MELIERYLKILKSGLPEAQKEDIARELSESIYSEIDDKEAQLKRPLSEAEVKEILQKRGNPLVVANRYRQDNRSLSFGRQIIGSALFPFYVRVLKFNLGLTAIVILVIFSALMISGQRVGVRDVFSTYFYQLLIQFAFVTVIFAAIDRQMAKHPDRWDSKTINQPCIPGLGGKANGGTVSRMESISQLIALAVYLVWLRAIRSLPFLVFGPAAAYMQATPVWRELYFPAVLLAVLSMAQSLVNLVQPNWVFVKSLTRVATDTGGVVMCFFLLAAGSWVMAVPGMEAEHAQAVAVVNQVVHYCLLAGGVIAALNLARGLRGLVRSMAGQSAQPQQQVPR